MQSSHPHHQIVVVGGSGDIGSAIVNRYISSGERVIIIDKNEPMRQASGSFMWMPADVMNLVDIRGIALELTRRRIVVSHLISLAGGALPGEHARDIMSVPDETIEDSISLNLTSHLWLVKSLMRDDPGNLGDRSVVFVSSVNALRGFGLTAYSAAKAGLLGATRELACAAWGERGVRVNAILPGTVPTVRTLKQPKDFDALLKTTTLGRFATPTDIAAGCYFLTHMTTVVTGQGIVIDAGQSVKAPGG